MSSSPSSPAVLVDRLTAIGVRLDGDTVILPATSDRGRLQIRVIEARVFGRVETDGRWTEADWRELPASELMDFYVDDSPVATWMREQEVDVIGAALAAMVWPR